MPLNKFLALTGICSRRKAVQLIKDGLVTINNNVVIQPGMPVSANDTVLYNGKLLTLKQSSVYIVLNKPEGFVTTASDELSRPTIFHLMKLAALRNKRLFPIGRLDMNTTGLLLITNDGELSQKLSHPKFHVAKVYKAQLDQELTTEDLHQLKNGIKLEDGFVRVDAIYFAKKNNRRRVVVEIHCGKNRIIRRLFKALGYNVTVLERIGFAGITKQKLPIGCWRFLTAKEVAHLKSL